GQHRARLPPGRVFGDRARDRRFALGIERKMRGLRDFLPDRAVADLFRPSLHRRFYLSISPNTMSIEPMIATASASMCRFDITSIACRCANPVGRILQRYGRL